MIIKQIFVNNKMFTRDNNKAHDHRVKMTSFNRHQLYSLRYAKKYTVYVPIEARRAKA